MAKKLELRSVTSEEEQRLRKLAASRTAPARLVQRAKVLVTMLDEPEVGAMEVGRRAGSGQSGCAWVRRFNDGGLEVLVEANQELGAERPALRECRRSAKCLGGGTQLLGATSAAVPVEKDPGDAAKPRARRLRIQPDPACCVGEELSERTT